jgi:hypothetical protein
VEILNLTYAGILVGTILLVVDRRSENETGHTTKGDRYFSSKFEFIFLTDASARERRRYIVRSALVI